MYVCIYMMMMLMLNTELDFEKTFSMISSGGWGMTEKSLTLLLSFLASTCCCDWFIFSSSSIKTRVTSIFFLIIVCMNALLIIERIYFIVLYPPTLIDMGAHVYGDSHVVRERW